MEIYKMKKSLYLSIFSLSTFILLYSDSCATLAPHGIPVIPVNTSTDITIRGYQELPTIKNSVSRDQAIRQLEESHNMGKQQLETYRASANNYGGSASKLQRVYASIGIEFPSTGRTPDKQTKILQIIGEKITALHTLLQQYIDHAESPGFDETSLRAACALLESGNPSNEEIAKVNKDLSALVKKLAEENSHLRQLALRKQEQELQQQFQQVAMEAATRGVAAGGILSAQTTLLNANVPENFVAVVVSVLLQLQESLPQQDPQHYLASLTSIATLIAKAGNQAAIVFGEEVCALIGKKNPEVTLKDPSAKTILEKYEVNFEGEATILQQDAFSLLQAIARFSNNEQILPQYMEPWKHIVVQIMAKKLSDKQTSLVLEAIAGSINNFEIPTLRDAIEKLVEDPTDKDLLFKVQSGKHALRLPITVKTLDLSDYGDSDCIPHEHGPREGFNTVTWGGENPTLDEILGSTKKTPNQTEVVCLLKHSTKVPYTILPPLIAPGLTKYPTGSKGAYRKKPKAQLDFRDRVEQNMGEIRVAVPLPVNNWDALYTNDGVKLPTVDTQAINYSQYTGVHKPWMIPIDHLKDYLHSMDPKDISFLNRSQVKFMPFATLSQLNTQQAQAFTNVVIQHFSPDQISVLFPHLALWQLFCIQPDAVKKVTWNDLFKKYTNDEEALQYFPIALIPHLCMRNNDEKIELSDPVLPNSLVLPEQLSSMGVPPPPPPPSTPPPPPPPMGSEIRTPLSKKSNEDIKSLNYCFTKMSPDQIQVISLRHIPYLSVKTLRHNNKVQLLTAEQWKEWVKYNGTHIGEIVLSLTPMQCACIPQEQLDWELIEKMKLEQVLFLSPEQVSSTLLPGTMSLDQPKQRIHNIVFQKQTVFDLTKKLNTVDTQAKDAKATKHTEIMRRYDECYWGNSGLPRLFNVHKIEINVKAATEAERYKKVTTPSSREYTWDQLTQYRETQKDNIVAILQNIPSLQVFFSGIGKDPTIFQYALPFSKIQTQLKQDLNEHIIVDIISGTAVGTATIESISLATPVETQSRTLKEYLLKKLSDSEKMEIETAETHAKNSGNSVAMQSIDAKTKDFLENLTWNSDAPPVPELVMLALEHTNATEEAQHLCRLNLTIQLNYMYFYSGYLLHDKTLLYIPPADIRKIRELRYGDGVIPGDAYISRPNLGFDKECISSNSPYTIIVPSTICMLNPDGVTHIYCGQDKIPLKDKYSSKNGTFITMPSLNALSTVAGNIFQDLQKRFDIPVKDPETVIAIWISKLVEFLEQYGDYWIATSNLQRKEIATLSQDDRDQFEPHLLPASINNIRKATIHFLNIWVQQMQTIGNTQLSDLLRKCFSIYVANGFINKEEFSRALK